MPSVSGCGGIGRTFPEPPEQGGGGGEAVVNTQSSLATSTSTTLDSTIVQMLGYHSPGDGGGGKFYWDSTVAPVLVSGATNATPIRLTTSSPHGLLNGQRIVIAGVTGNTAANGTWFVNFVDTTHVDLYSDFFRVVPSAGNGAYAGSGTCKYDGDGGIVQAPTVNTTSAGVWRRLGEYDIINVRWYGAVGNGVTDDSTSINYVLRAALHSVGRTIYFPSGTNTIATYIIGSTLMASPDNITDNLYIVGAGNLGAVLKYTGGDRTLTITNVTNTNPAVVTFSAPHGCLSNQPLTISGVVGPTIVNVEVLVTYVSPTQLSLNAIDTTLAPPYVSGGSATGGALILFEKLKRFSIKNIQFRANTASIPATGKNLNGIFLGGPGTTEQDSYGYFECVQISFFNYGLKGGTDAGNAPCAAQMVATNCNFETNEYGFDLHNQNTLNWAFRSCWWGSNNVGGNAGFGANLVVDGFATGGNLVADFTIKAGNPGVYKFANGRTETQAKFLTTSGGCHVVVDNCQIKNTSVNPTSNEMITVSNSGSFTLKDSNVEGSVNITGATPAVFAVNSSTRCLATITNNYTTAVMNSWTLTSSPVSLSELDKSGVRVFDYTNSLILPFTIINCTAMPSDSTSGVIQLEDQVGVINSSAVNGPLAKKPIHRQYLAAKNGTVDPYQKLSCVAGLSATTTYSANLAGSFTVADAATTATVTFTSPLLQAIATPEPDTSYRILCTPETLTNAPAAGSTRILSVTKTVNDFTATVEVAPGMGNSVKFNWMLVR